MKLPETSEFNVVNAFSALQKENKNVEVGIGDDGAILNLNGKTAWVTDTLTEGVHFKTEWSTPLDVLHKALVANLSDIGAMGAKPTAWLLNLGVGPAWKEITPLQWQEYMKVLQKKYPYALIGGDTFSALHCSVTISVVGELVQKPLLRSNALVGMDLYISGVLGRSASGLEDLQLGRQGEWVEYHKKPNYPEGLGVFLGQCPNVAAIDLSDGLAASCHHISHASEVQLSVNENWLPLASGLKIEVDSEKYLFGGEEFELLFAIEPVKAILEPILELCLLTKIGSITAGSGVVIHNDGKHERSLPLQGFEHLQK